MDSDEAHERMAELLAQNRRRRQAEQDSLDLDEMGITHTVLTEPERSHLLELSRAWYSTSELPWMRADITLPSFGVLVAWLDAEFPLPAIGAPNIARAGDEPPIFRVELSSWDEFTALVPTWFAVQVYASDSGKNATIQMSTESYYFVRVDWPRL